MSARALALVLAMVSPASGLAAPSALGPSGAADAPASANGSQTKSTEAVTKEETAPAARPAAPPTKQKKQAKLNALRKSCYGGFQGTIAPLVREARDRQMMEAIRLQEPAALLRPAQILLQGGDEHPSLLEAYQQALATSDQPEDEEKAKACRELLDLLVRQERR